ncbi:MAG: carbamoyl phosphate synthase small subunit [Candidatus Brocadiia bacterium]
MDGYLILADGTKLEGEFVTDPKENPTVAVGWVAANTAIVGFQEMATDPAYRERILAFTYPEIGNVGITDDAFESDSFQIAGLIVKVLSDLPSHYRSQGNFGDALAEQKIPCLVDVDTRALAVHLRTEGEMPAAIVTPDADEADVTTQLADMARPDFQPPKHVSETEEGSDPRVSVLDLGLRRSTLQQLARCCNPSPIPWDSAPDDILESEPDGVLVSDGPGGSLPADQTIETLRELRGRVPLYGWGLGHVALGMALGCEPTFLKRGHHGANYPIRNVVDGSLEIAVQRHTVLLDRESVESCENAEVLWENLNDETVEGIRSADGSIVGMQVLPVPPHPDGVNPHMQSFVDRLAGK